MNIRMILLFEKIKLKIKLKHILKSNSAVIFEYSRDGKYPMALYINCTIIKCAESKFISVLAGPLKGVIGLSDKEICDLTDYFRIQDGRILYSQFCEIIHDNSMNIFY